MKSDEYLKYIKKKKHTKRLIVIVQLFILFSFIFLWEILARYQVINTFLFSSPSKIVNTIFNLYQKNDLFKHIFITVYETFLSFSISSIFGVILASFLWWNKFMYKVLDPYLTVINSLPKVALGPLIIIWIGASVNSIIVMALMISLIISVINIYNAFASTNCCYVTLLKSFKANKLQIFTKVILPSNFGNIINTFKINISMSLIGVIMGELLVSKKGLGYLIMYGSQVFNINLILSSVIILGIISYLMYYLISIIEKKLV